MDCHICGTKLKDIKLGPDHKPKPCTDCEEAITACIQGYDQEPGHLTEEDLEVGFGVWPTPEFLK